MHDRHPISCGRGSAQILAVVVSNEAIHHIEPGDSPFETGSPRGDMVEVVEISLECGYLSHVC